MNKRLSVAALFILVVALVVGRADAAEPCPADSVTGLVEGKRISILVEGKGPDIVLVPGLSTPRAVWEATAERLKPRYRLHRVQIRGFGDEAGLNADGPVLEPMMREVADYIDDCITDAGHPAPAIIGHSMGGLTGPVTDPGEASPMGRMSNSPAGRIRVAEWTRASDPQVIAQVLYDVMTTDLRPELSGVTAPVTLLYAQDDSALPAAMAKAAFEPQYTGIADFRPQMISGSRHFIMLDQPQAFAAAVDTFLAD